MRTWCLVGLLWCNAGFALEQTRLTELLEAAREEMAMPGLRAAVRFSDGSLVRAAVGEADREAGVALDNEVSIPGGSTGKTFVAALLMLLVEDGVVGLDDPARRWVGDQSWYGELPNAEGMRVRHLLSHSAGLPDYPYVTRYRTASLWRGIRRGTIYFETHELLDMLGGRDALFVPGEGYSYADTGYLVLGKIIEAATGRDYYALLTERILRPLGLEAVQPQNRAVMPGVPTGYISGGVFGLGRTLNDEGIAKYDPRTEWTGGGLATTPTMLVHFYAALAAGEVVQPESFRTMLQSGWRDPEQPDWHYGFGLFVWADGQEIGHGGMWPGYRTRVEHHRLTGTTIAVQTNRNGRLDMPGLIDRIAALQ